MTFSSLRQKSCCQILAALKLRLLPAAFLLAAMLLGIATSRAEGGFLFVTFKGEASPMAEQIYFALSQDGCQWEALNKSAPVLVSHVGEKGVRDPFLLRSHNGRKFYLLATDLSINLNHDWRRATHAGSKSIVIWESTNLVSWSEPRLVQAAPDDAGCTWAPEAIYDETKKEYLAFWASTTARDDFAKQSIWAAWTKDFIHFEKPFPYIENAGAVIDTDIVHDHGKYYRFSKDEKFKAITMEVSEKLMGPWTDVPEFSLAKIKGYEGPECYRINSTSQGQPDTWCLILDQYSTGSGYQPFVTTDLGAGQFTPGTGFKFPFKFRHGSILAISQAEYLQLLASYGK
jgi:hypothetical protein